MVVQLHLPSSLLSFYEEGEEGGKCEKKGILPVMPSTAVILYCKGTTFRPIANLLLHPPKLHSCHRTRSSPPNVRIIIRTSHRSSIPSCERDISGARQVYDVYVHMHA